MKTNNRSDLGDGTQALVELGLTGMESDVYAYLLRQSPVTGYRVAAGIGKPVANTYKAINSLAEKGAIVVDEGQSRLCRAVPPAELMARLERDFKGRQKRALDALSSLPGAPADDRVYQMRSSEQVYERCRSLLADAEQAVLVDAFPLPLEELRIDLRDAAARGVKVYAKVYRQDVVDGVTVIVDPDGSEVLGRWPGQWLNMVVDGAEYVHALLGEDGQSVHQAVWSGSAYLAWVYHSAFWSELALAEVIRRTDAQVPSTEINRWLRELKNQMHSELSGYRTLLERFGRSKRPQPTDHTVTEV